MSETQNEEPVADVERNEPTVVVAVDGSEPSSVALTWAAEEARLRAATLKVVRVWRIPALAYQGYVSPIPGVEDWGAQEQAALDEQVAKVLGDLPAVKLVAELREGPSAAEIIAAANGADLLVVGSRGRGGFAGLLLGSVSAQVVHHARCPVVVVPNPA